MSGPMENLAAGVLARLCGRGGAALLAVSLLLAQPAQAADREELSDFLAITGFDVALENLESSAVQAPRMVGLDAHDFGVTWTHIVRDIFDPRDLRDMALDILAETLEDDVLSHAAAFYVSPLGRRLVAAENAAAAQRDRSARNEIGRTILAQLGEGQSPRLENLRRMVRAANGLDAAVHALTEIQYRFLLAAEAAEVIRLKQSHAALRDTLAARGARMRERLGRSALVSAAYVYRDFDDSELRRYAEALEKDAMRRAYALMNAVQYEIVADRFEVLAERMAALRPEQET